MRHVDASGRNLDMKLLYWPAAILKKISEELTAAPDFQMVSDLKAVMRAHGGVGLSAIQVGIPIRLVVVDSGALGPSVFVNPVITEFRGTKELKREGCLSVPGFTEYISRFPEIVVTYRDENFELHENVEFHGFIAHALQHELEHLDGKLYLDHLNAARRGAIMGNMQALRRAGKLK